jgi:hypothetical protein
MLLQSIIKLICNYQNYAAYQHFPLTLSDSSVAFPSFSAFFCLSKFAFNLFSAFIASSKRVLNCLNFSAICFESFAVASRTLSSRAFTTLWRFLRFLRLGRILLSRKRNWVDLLLECTVSRDVTCKYFYFLISTTVKFNLRTSSWAYVSASCIVAFSFSSMAPLAAAIPELIDSLIESKLFSAKLVLMIR